MATDIAYEVTAECTHSHTLDLDSLDCHLANGHLGPHKAMAEGAAVWWQKDDSDE